MKKKETYASFLQKMMKLNNFLPEKVQRFHDGMKLYFKMPEVPHRVCFAVRGTSPTIVTGRLLNYVSPKPLHALTLEEDDLQFMMDNEEYFMKEAENVLEWIDAGTPNTMSCRSLMAQEQIRSSDEFLFFEPTSNCFIITLHYNTIPEDVFLRVAQKNKITFFSQRISCYEKNDVA